MKWILYLAILIGVLVAAVFGIGYALPVETTFTRSITLKEKLAAVFAALADVQHFPQWNRNT